VWQAPGTLLIVSTLYSSFNCQFDFFQVLQEAKEKAEVESQQNNQVEIKKGYAYLLDSFQGNNFKYIILFLLHE